MDATAMDTTAMDTTEGHLLGGRLHHRQPRAGHRTGIEPVLLAASIPARPGERVLEAGTGSGAALLCLAARVPGVLGVGIEIVTEMAALARANFAANGFTGLDVIAGDLDHVGLPGLFDHAAANPPWHDPDSSKSTDTQREVAKRGRPGLLARWAASLARPLRPRGTLTFVLPAGVMPDAIAAFTAARIGSLALMPLWPRQGRPAKLVLVQGTKGGRAPFRVLPGLTLHADAAGYTPEADAVLRTGAMLDFNARS